TARKKPRVKQTEADAAADLLLAPEEAQKPRPPSPPSPRAKAPESPSLPSRSANEPKPSRPPLLEKGAGESDSSEPPDDDDIIPLHEETTPARAEEEEPEREVRIEGTQEDDRNPYRVTGDIKKKLCPECQKSIDYRENFCVHCGFNLKTGEKSKRNFQPINRE